jgi:RNA polymerase sigma factor (TIGR02999 family)
MFYEELRRIAGGQLLGERPSHTLQATALVNEVYFKLKQQQGVREQDDDKLRLEGDFFALARYLMRQILIEHGRARQTLKRRHFKVPLDDALYLCHEPAPEADKILDVLTRLEQQDPLARSIIDLRYFCGYSIEETAAALGIGKTKVKEDCRVALLWLQRELRTDGEGRRA